MTIDVPNWLQNGSYPARVDRMLIDAIFSEGVLEGWTVSQRAAGANLSVDVAPGLAVVTGDDSPDQGKYLVHNNAVINVNVDAGGAQPRIDSVYLRVRDPASGGLAGDDAVVVIVKGTEAASPVPAAAPPTALLLGHVTVLASASSIGNADVSMALRPQAGMGLNQGLPIGSIVPVASVIAVPPAWLICDGITYQRGQYPDLHVMLRDANGPGTYPYGAGDGTTTFNVPDLTGRVPVGQTPSSTMLNGLKPVGTKFGLGTRAISVAQLPSHTHAPGTLSTSSSGAHTHTATTSSAGAHTHGVDFNATGNPLMTPGSSFQFQGGSVGAIGSLEILSGGAHTHTLTTVSAGAHTHTFGGATAATGSGSLLETIQPSLTVGGYIIRAI